MIYKYLYLPVDKPLEDGCMVISSNGDVFEYHAVNHYTARKLIVGEPFIVKIEYNQMHVVGIPSPDARWLKNGDVIPRPLHSLVVGDSVVKIKCPTCDKTY